MAIRQLGKNSYLIEQMVDNKRYSVTVDHKPKKAEAQALIEAQIRKDVKSDMIKEPPYIPTSEEIEKVLTYLKDTRYWVGVMLGVFGLRQSEILALTMDDLNGNILTVNKASVPSGTKSDSFVTKSTKTAASLRSIVLPDNVVERIHEQGFIYKGDDLSKALKRAQRDLGIPHFTFHKLIHFRLGKEDINDNTPKG